MPQQIQRTLGAALTLVATYMLTVECIGIGVSKLCFIIQTLDTNVAYYYKLHVYVYLYAHNIFLHCILCAPKFSLLLCFFSLDIQR